MQGAWGSIPVQGTKIPPAVPHRQKNNIKSEIKKQTKQNKDCVLTSCRWLSPEGTSGSGEQGGDEMKWGSLSRVRLFATPCTVGSSLYMEFSRQEYWSGLPLPFPGDLPNPGREPRSPTLQTDSLPSEPQGKPKNTGVGSLSLLRWIFPGQESNQGLLPCRWIPYQLSYKGLKFCQKTRFYVRCVHQKIIIKRKILEVIVMIGHRLWCSFTGIYLPPNSSSCITSIYAAFFFFLLMWTVFKVFIEFVAILFLFYALVFWPWGMWDLNSLGRD